MKKISAYFIVTRPVNAFIGILSTFSGALISGTIQPFQNVLLACLSVGFIAASANSINDYYDLEIDKINKPNRPLPSGKLTPREVFIFSLILYALGMLTSVFINLQALLISFFSILLTFLYSAYLKRTVLWGNLSVSLVTGLAFIYGGVAVNRFYESLIPAGFSFLFHLGREIIKDTEDIKGDSMNRITTLPIKMGIPFALAVATLVYVILIFVTLIPYFFNIYGVYYFYTVLIGVDLVVVLILISCWFNSSAKNLGQMSVLLKADMLLGLIALFVGRY